MVSVGVGQVQDTLLQQHAHFGPVISLSRIHQRSDSTVHGRVRAGVSGQAAAEPPLCCRVWHTGGGPIVPGLAWFT